MRINLGNNPKPISASCFRLLSLLPEVQNDVEVVKPVLGELEVMRLCCSLGMLSSMEAKDFELEMLEAREFDEDFAIFLRKTILATDKDDRGGDVKVISLFGKQEGVKAELDRLNCWSAEMDSELKVEDQGIYCVTQQGDTMRTLVMFGWIEDRLFHKSRLRDTATYVLRFLTCLSGDMVCCLSPEDVALLEKSVASMNSSSLDAWKSFSVAFHVQRQEEQKDAVVCDSTTNVYLTRAECGRTIEMLKGSYPAVVLVEPAPATKWVESTYKSFDDSEEFAKWLVGEAERCNIRVDFGYQGGYEGGELMRKELLRASGRWPGDKLKEVEEIVDRSLDSADEQAREEIEASIEKQRDELLTIADKAFDLDVLHKAARDEPAFITVNKYLQEVRKDKGLWDKLDPATKATLSFPLRLKNQMKALVGRFNESLTSDPDATESSQALANFLRDLTISEDTKVVADKDSWFSRVNKAFWGTKEEDIRQKFRDCMADPLAEARGVWFEAVEKVFGIVEKALMQRKKDETCRSLRQTCTQDKRKLVSEAFEGLVRSWQDQHKDGLTTTVRPRRRYRGVACPVDKEHWKPAADQLKIYKLVSNDDGKYNATLLGTHRLLPDAKLLKAFTVRNHCVVVATNNREGTLVERVDFPVQSAWWGDQTGRVSLKRQYKRLAITCDFNVHDRTIAFVEEGGSVLLYRFNESFMSLEISKRVELSLRSSLTLPVADVLVLDGAIYAVDAKGMIQSVNLRNQQTSQGVQIRSPESSASCSSLFAMADSMVLGCIVNRASEEHEGGVCAFSSEDFRKIPVTQPTDVLRSQGLSAQCFGDLLFTLGAEANVIRVSRLTVTVRSESFRIQHSNEQTVNGTATKSGETDAEGVDHWLRAFYHMFEKFPVRGLVRGVDDTQTTLTLRLTSSVDLPKSAVDSCRYFFQAVMRDLRKLNKPLGGMDLVQGLVSINEWRSATQEGLNKLAARPLQSFLLELITFVPIQICRAEGNALTLMDNGQARTMNSQQGMQAVQIARSIRFGLLSPLLEAWQGRCVVITSMGKQSTGKSYLLNHLTGSSFAIAGARCTDGAWMTLRILPNDILLVVLDFEGLGSFERTEQEDVFLSVLNASISMFTIFRMEMRYDKEIDDLFSRFQKGVALIKGDPSLFRGKLYMSVKDVNPNDQKGVLDEFLTKFQKLVGANKENNFLLDLYSGQLDINCSPPLGTIGYYQSLMHAQNFIEQSLCGDVRGGFRNGKAFLNCIRLVLAKIAILDWTSLDEGAKQFQLSEVCSKLPGIVRTGCIVPQDYVEANESIAAYLKEDLLSSANGKVLNVELETLCADYPAMAEKWALLNDKIELDKVLDWTIDLGFDCCATSDENVANIHKALSKLFQLFMDKNDDLRGTKKLRKEVMLEFDSFLAFVVRRRKARVALWAKQMLGDRMLEDWKSVEQQFLGRFQMLLARCQSNCANCRLGCMQAAAHASSVAHDCAGSHTCLGRCEYCERRGHFGKTPPCAKEAGHEGRCECTEGDHTCGEACCMAGSPNCGKQCSLKRGHTELHQCDVPMHMCGEACSARHCCGRCVLNVEEPHTAHKCVEVRCMEKCIMDGCSEPCGAMDHFHGQTEVAVVFSVENGDDKSSDTFDAASETPVVHMCGNRHECQALCAENGICRVDVFLKQSSKTFKGARGTFDFTYQEMNGSRKKCSKLLAPGQQTHQGAHTCVCENGADSGEEIIHYCDVRCPCCSYFCKKKFGHFGAHTTSHGNMRNTYFLSDTGEIDVEARKYKSGEQGIAEMCNLYCSKMGRAHVHYVDCEQGSKSKCVYSGGTKDQRRHCTRALEPIPEKDIDEILHEQFWKTLGWEDPCTSKLELELFAKCDYKCDAPEHDEKPSLCVLPAWHKPETKPTAGFDGFTYVSGHKFECSHVASGGKMHHVFVLDCSGSMSGRPWTDLLAAVREYIYNRISDGATLDLVSVVTFDSSAQIVYEAQNITTMTRVNIPYRGGGTTYSTGLRSAAEVLSRVNFDVYKPAVVFFSDGQPQDPLQGEAMAVHIKSCFEKYGLLAFAVGFGSINLSVLQRVAQKMGGEYHQVLTGVELKTTFFTISASMSSRAGLALAKPAHERNCVICEQDLASGETVALKACGHELHAACRDVLMRNAEQDGASARCPSCRREISA